jgi:hypothetical protein
MRPVRDVMNGRPEERAQSNGGFDPGRDGAPVGDHLSADQLNAYLDHAVSAGESSLIATHLSTCVSCSESLAGLRATQAMLRALPSPAPSRSFRLGPEYARSRDSIWDRFGAWLLPTLPALRAATIAIALLLAAVSARNVLDDPASNGPTGDTAMVAQQAETVQSTATAGGQSAAALELNQNGTVPTAQSTSLPFAATEDTGVIEAPPAGSDEELLPAPEVAESADEAPIESEDSFDGETSLDEEPTMSGASEPGSGAVADEDSESETDVVSADDAGSDASAQESTSMRVDNGAGAAGNAAEPSTAESSMAMVVELTQVVSPVATSSPTPTSTPTAIPTATATSTATVTPPAPAPTPEPEHAAVAETDQWDFWNVAQLVLAILLVLMLALIGILALRRRRVSR